MKKLVYASYIALGLFCVAFFCLSTWGNLGQEAITALRLGLIAFILATSVTEFIAYIKKRKALDADTRLDEKVRLIGINIVKAIWTATILRYVLGR